MFTISFFLVAWCWALIQSDSVIFRDDIHVFPVNTVKNSLICPSILTELIRSISQDELTKFHKIAWNLLTFPIPIALYFRLSYFHRSKLNVEVFSVGSCYLAHNMSLLSIYLLPKYTSDASSASHQNTSYLRSQLCAPYSNPSRITYGSSTVNVFQLRIQTTCSTILEKIYCVWKILCDVKQRRESGFVD